jgi:hypothetical protein
MSQATYRRSLREPVRALWSGVFDRGQFNATMLSAIDIGLRQAWDQGARTVGIAPDEKTFDDFLNLEEAIIKERSFISSLQAYIEANRRELQPRGEVRASLARVYSRVELWVKRWLDVFNQGALSGTIDPKLLWTYDPRKENCTTCAKLNGKVKRKSVWQTAGVRPQNAPNRMLDCEGWECGCTLTPTDLPASKGRLPKLP